MATGRRHGAFVRCVRGEFLGRRHGLAVSPGPVPCGATLLHVHAVPQGLGDRPQTQFAECSLASRCGGEECCER